MILSPVFSNGKKMPYEFGYVAAKGTAIEAQVYTELLYREVESAVSLENSTTHKKVDFEVKDIVETSNKVLRLVLKPQ